MRQRYVAGMFGTIFSFIDQLVSSLAPIIVGFVVASIGFKDAFPTVNDPLTSTLFTATLVLAFGIPALCLLISIVTMHFYKLDSKAMVDVQEKIAHIRSNKRNNAKAE